jgi:hypothetical protein
MTSLSSTGKKLIFSDVGGGFRIWSSYEWALESVVWTFGLENVLGTTNVAEKLMTRGVHGETKNT